MTWWLQRWTTTRQQFNFFLCTGDYTITTGEFQVCVFVCVFTNQFNHFVVWMCPGFICIWRWLHLGDWMPRDLFCNPGAERDARVSAFCLRQSANPLTSPAKSHYLVSLLSSLFTLSVPISFSLIQFLSAWLARTLLWVSHILFVLNGLWPSHSWVPVFLQCVSPLSSLSLKHAHTALLATAGT